MRKEQKAHVLDIVQTLYQAHNVIKDNIISSDLDSATALLGECQNIAYELGEIIERSEGDGCSTVKFLEQYCNALYEVAVGLPGEFSGKNAKGHLDKALSAAEKSAHGIRVRYEVVFMPYKAAMWDSLESIWRAADADPDCDAYVIPIPYYDRKPDGSLGAYHYEGADFPDDVPVVSYRSYSLEKRRPDVIYIHNPYDHTNYVTSVDPKYYSRQLKKNTAYLIYVPYFVLDEIDRNNEEIVAKIAHFCMVPAILNADVIVVQSENMRQIYIDVLTKSYGSDTRQIWESKVASWGSPKFDKISAAGSIGFTMPEEWLSMAQKTDGRMKKIILYNTSVGALLEHNERMLEKMQGVFNLFREHCDEITLLWRPHPLLKSTIERMRPGLAKRYAAIEKQYRSEQWGIYDDTADLNRAIALSDAYYGDWSSLVQLYQKTGKPIMIQDIGELQK